MYDPRVPEHDSGEDELEELFARDRETWRGDVHPESDSWRREPSDELWRGEEHLADWPEHAAGPEYWMFKAMIEGA